MVGTKFEKINLESYFNNKGVSWLEPKIFAQLEHSGASLAGELLPNNEEIIYNEILFNFPKTDTTENDHISCEGQIILVSSKKAYRTIAFLGLATWGDYCHGLGIRYKENIYEEVPFNISNACRLVLDKELMPNEYIGIEVPYHRRQDNKVEISMGLWVQRVNIDANKELLSVELPDNPYVHIFAITLLKE